MLKHMLALKSSIEHKSSAKNKTSEAKIFEIDFLIILNEENLGGKNFGENHRRSKHCETYKDRYFTIIFGQECPQYLKV